MPDAAMINRKDKIRTIMLLYTLHYMRIIAFMLFFTGNVVFVNAQHDTTNQTDARNLKQGYWEKKYPNGELIYRGYFKDDKPVGEMKRFYESGALQAVLIYGETGEYVRARLFYENGNLAAEGLYYNMEKDSIWDYYSYYDESLTLKESYNKGKRDGPVLHYYIDGVLSEKMEWKDDIRHGSWIQYFTDGSVRLEAAYLNGKLEGDFIVYQEGEIPYIKGTYLNNERHGLWTFYNEDGTVDMALHYQNGTCLDEEILDEQQQEFFRMIDENKGKISEPDETEFLSPSGR